MKDVRCRDVWWVNMEEIFPQKEHAYKKIRPCVVISNSMNNIHNDYVTIVPLTTKYDGLPQHIDVYVCETCAKLLFTGMDNNST